MKKYINSIRSNDSPILLDQFLIRNLPVSSVFFFWQLIFVYGQGFIHHFTHWLSLTMAEEHSSPVCQISDFPPPRLKMVLFLCIFLFPAPLWVQYLLVISHILKYRRLWVFHLSTWDTMPWSLFIFVIKYIFSKCWTKGKRGETLLDPTL